jgi:hypothetical protein
MRSIAVVCSTGIGVAFLMSPAFAQEKTAKACQAEWRANKADNQAKGITEKAYVAKCRGGDSAAKPAPAPAASTAKEKKEKKTTAAAAPAATEKTAKACRDEWRANKADNQAKGITEKAYVTQCRAGTAAVQPAPAPAAEKKTTAAPPPAAAPEKKTTAAPAPAPEKKTATTPMAPPPAASTAPTGANQYTTEAQAKGRCGTGTVVWANLDSKIYHFASYKDYGNTKSGAYMCERDATSQGMRASKNEKHP